MVIFDFLIYEEVKSILGIFVYCLFIFKSLWKSRFIFIVSQKEYFLRLHGWTAQGILLSYFKFL